MISETDGARLLQIARHSIEQRLGNARENVALTDRGSSVLQENLCSFVTLHQSGELRGCVGRLQSVGPLRDDVAHNACAAAFSDPRFTPLRDEELSQVEISVSVLGPATPLSFSCESDLLNQLQPGDGVVLRDGTRQATFLPDVWSTLPEPHRFWRALKRKAGLADRYWSDSLQVSRYSTWRFCESQSRPATRN